MSRFSGTPRFYHKTAIETKCPFKVSEDTTHWEVPADGTIFHVSAGLTHSIQSGRLTVTFSVVGALEASPMNELGDAYPHWTDIDDMAHAITAGERLQMVARATTDGDGHIYIHDKDLHVFATILIRGTDGKVYRSQWSGKLSDATANPEASRIDNPTTIQYTNLIGSGLLLPLKLTSTGIVG